MADGSKVMSEPKVLSASAGSEVLFLSDIPDFAKGEAHSGLDPTARRELVRRYEEENAKLLRMPCVVGDPESWRMPEAAPLDIPGKSGYHAPACPRATTDPHCRPV
jgi:hypothetical protein